MGSEMCDVMNECLPLSHYSSSLIVTTTPSKPPTSTNKNTHIYLVLYYYIEINLYHKINQHTLDGSECVKQMSVSRRLTFDYLMIVMVSFETLLLFCLVFFISFPRFRIVDYLKGILSNNNNTRTRAYCRTHPCSSSFSSYYVHHHLLW